MSHKPNGFDEVIAPLTRNQFMADYWGRKFLHLSGSKARFTPLLSWEALNAILEWHSPPQPQVRLFQDGQMVDVRRYIDGPVGALRLNAGGLVASLSQGASMIMDAVQEVAPPVHDLVQDIADALDGHAIANLYAGWRAQKAFDLHWDPHDVIVLQLSGRKHWKVYAPTRLHPLGDDLEKAVPPEGPPVFDGILNDGDMLYLPRGWWHMAVALDEPSLHLSIGIEPATGADFLQWLTRNLLKHPEVRQNLPPHQDYPAQLLNLMQAGVEGDPLGQFLAERKAARRVRPRVRLPLAPMEQLQAIGPATCFRLAVQDHLFLEHPAGERMAKFNIGGTDYSFAPDLIPAFRKLSGRHAVSLQELCVGIQNQQLVGMLVGALEMLAKAGVVLKEQAAS